MAARSFGGFQESQYSILSKKWSGVQDDLQHRLSFPSPFTTNGASGGEDLLPPFCKDVNATSLLSCAHHDLRHCNLRFSSSLVSSFQELFRCKRRNFSPNCERSNSALQCNMHWCKIILGMKHERLTYDIIQQVW